MSQSIPSPVLCGVAVSLLLAACVPAYVDSVQPPGSATEGATPASDEPVRESRVIPADPSPPDVVRPPSVPDPAASFQPEPPISRPPSQPRIVPPTRPVWQQPSPAYRANRPDAAPLGIPNQPPAAYRY